jgi:hypothetical protein
LVAKPATPACEPLKPGAPKVAKAALKPSAPKDTAARKPAPHVPAQRKSSGRKSNDDRVIRSTLARLGVKSNVKLTPEIRALALDYVELQVQLKDYAS